MTGVALASTTTEATVISIDERAVDVSYIIFSISNWNVPKACEELDDASDKISVESREFARKLDATPYENDEWRGTFLLRRTGELHLLYQETTSQTIYRSHGRSFFDGGLTHGKHKTMSPSDTPVWKATSFHVDDKGNFHAFDDANRDRPLAAPRVLHLTDESRDPSL